MGGAARRCVLLGFNQPRPSFCGGCFDAFGGAFSTIEDLRRLAPAMPSRELYRQQRPHSRPMLAGSSPRIRENAEAILGFLLHAFWRASHPPFLSSRIGGSRRGAI